MTSTLISRPKAEPAAPPTQAARGADGDGRAPEHEHASVVNMAGRKVASAVYQCGRAVGVFAATAFSVAILGESDV